MQMRRKLLEAQEDFSCHDVAFYLCNCEAHYERSDEYEKNFHKQESNGGKIGMI